MKKTIAECQAVDWSIGYSEHIDRMEARYKQGDRQLFCARCDRWKFPDELCDEARPCETKRTKDGGLKVVKELPWPEENTCQE